MKKRFIAVLAVLCICLLAFSACSASPEETAMSEESVAEAPQAAYDADSAAAEDYYMEDTGEYAVSGESYEEEPYTEGDGFSISTANIPETDRKLVYSARFVIDTTNYEQDYNLILEKLADAGGYVEYESTEGTVPDQTTYEGRYSTLTMRVPVDNFDAFFTGISGIGKIVQQSRSTEDISGNYYDTESRIELLEGQRDRLMGYLEAATKPEDIISYEQELTDVLYELDQLQGNKLRMDSLVDYTTVEVTIYETVIAADVPVDEDGLPVGDRANDAFSKSMSGVGQFLEDFAVGFAAATPVLILLAIIAVVVVLVLKLIRSLRKKYGREKPKKQPPQPWHNPYQPPQPPVSGMQPPQGQRPPQPPPENSNPR